MKRNYLILLNFLLCTFVAGCAQLPPTPADIQAKKFQPVPDRAVIYIVRPLVDGNVHGPLSIPGGMITTHPGTYHRLEVAPGAHQITGAAGWGVSVTVQTEAGKIYFVEQVATGGPREGLQSMSLRRIDETLGRRMVLDATLL